MQHLVRCSLYQKTQWRMQHWTVNMWLRKNPAKLSLLFFPWENRKPLNYKMYIYLIVIPYCWQQVKFNYNRHWLGVQDSPLGITIVTHYNWPETVLQNLEADDRALGISNVNTVILALLINSNDLFLVSWQFNTETDHYSSAVPKYCSASQEESGFMLY